MRKYKIMISSADHQRLTKLLNSVRLDRRIPLENIEALEGELAQAKIVEPAKLPADVVSMDSTVWFRDLESGEVEKYTLVAPAEADVVNDRISVLAPIGTALLGYRVNDVVEWRVPSGKRRLQITRVEQPTVTAQGTQLGAMA